MHGPLNVKEISTYVIVQIRQRALLLGSIQQSHFSGKLTYTSVTS
jgi:hypothetical protein